MIALVAVVILLAAAPAAVAKGIARVEVCGQGDCNVLVPGKPGTNAIQQRDLEELNEVVGPTDPPPRALGWYRVRTVIEHRGVDENSWTNAWVPGVLLLRARNDTGDGYTWFTVPRDTALSLLKVTRKLKPRPAATLKGLDAKLPVARVDRVVRASSTGGGGGLPWYWIGLAAVCVAGAGVAFPRARRRRT